MPNSSQSYASAPPKLIAGARVLDFLNTVGWRGAPGCRSERLTSYGELLIWSAYAGLISEHEHRLLTAAAEQQPRATQRALSRTIAFREAIATLLQPPPGDAAPFDQVNAILAGLSTSQRLAPGSEGRYIAVGVPAGPLLALPMHRLALELVALLTHHPSAAIRSCGNTHCGWLFLDTSRNRTRRWCDMATCGNQAKARLHYARSKSRRTRPRAAQHKGRSSP